MPPIPLADEYMSRFRRELAQGAPGRSGAGIPPAARTWTWGSTVHFRIGEPWHHLLPSGWSHAEPAYTWSDGRQGVLELEAPPEHRDVLVRLAYVPFLHGPVVRQRFRIAHDHRPIGDFTATATGEATVVILAPPSGRRALRLIWEFPDAASPAELGLAGDYRKLAIALVSVTANLL